MNKVRRKALVDIQAKIEEIDELDNALSSKVLCEHVKAGE